MRKALVLLSTVALLLVTGNVLAGDVPNVMTSQGILRNAAGDVVNGVYTLKFKLYNAQVDGQLLWSEAQANLVVENGLYTATLGTVSPLPASLFQQSQEVWLGISVEAEQELPRVRVTTVAFAFNARAAMTADKANLLNCSQCVTEGMLQFDPVTESELPAKAVDAVKKSGEFISKTGGNIAGNLQVSGIVTASVFVGDGSGLTGVSSPSGECAAGWFVSGIQTNGALVCKEGASAIKSVDGLSGGTIKSDVDVTGALSVNGLDVCTIDGNCGETLGQLVCKANQIAMYNGSNWVCSNFVKETPTEPCSGQNNVLSWDGSKFACKVLTGTGPSGGKAQGFELLDSWGFTWDGMMRPAMNWTDADALCKSLGARLPTGTELYRVSQNQTKLFGPMATGDWQWTVVRYSSTGHSIGRLNDGEVEYTGDTSAINFRCVWSNNTKDYYTGNHCYGPPGNECFGLATQGNLYVMDSYDRPPMRYSAAFAECAFYYSHMPDAGRLTQAIRAGLPNGTNSHLWTSDQVEWQSGNIRYHMIARWSGVNMNFNAYWDEGNAGQDGSEYRFRCVGVKQAHTTTPVNVPNSSFSKTYLTTTKTDEGTELLTDAMDKCYKKGAHLATSNELYELINGKLSGGSDTWMWVADWIGNWSSPWWLQSVKWAGTIESIDPADGNHTTNVHRSDGTKRPYRCVWYPVDKDYKGPQSCNGGCFEVKIADTDPPVKMWMDKSDRSGTHWAGAQQLCYLAGGHMAGRRDLFEMIRAGLPAGSNNWLWTNEIEGVHSGNHPLASIMRWAGENTGYNDYSEPSWAHISDGRPYRCFWTNELR